jgi:uncharacterized protein VirK/YbjX
MVHALLNYSAVRNWYEIADNTLLISALARFPLMSGAMYWPYINHTWSMNQKLASIDQHYRMLDGPAAIIAHATLREVELARLDEECNGLRIVLDKTEWFLREGEIVLNLFINEQRFYSLAFTIGMDRGQPVAIVGALQGSNADNAQEVYRHLTHALYGMRPRDFIMSAFKLLCVELKVDSILAISGDMRQHNSPYFGGSHKNKVLVTYDQVWIEHGGALLDNGFYELPAKVKSKDMDDVATRKRATYRRRFQMLDKLALDIKSVIAQYASKS